MHTCFILQYIYYIPLHVSSIICSSLSKIDTMFKGQNFFFDCLTLAVETYPPPPKKKQYQTTPHNIPEKQRLELSCGRILKRLHQDFPKIAALFMVIIKDTVEYEIIKM